MGRDDLTPHEEQTGSYAPPSEKLLEAAKQLEQPAQAEHVPARVDSDKTGPGYAEYEAMREKMRGDETPLPVPIDDPDKARRVREGLRAQAEYRARQEADVAAAHRAIEAAYENDGE